MRLLAWNINHRAKAKAIPARLAEIIGSLAVDVAVLTEYVPGPSREGFLADLASIGLRHAVASEHIQGENSVVIASRSPMECGAIRAPAIARSVPSNALHVQLPAEGVEILGLRIPDYSKQPRFRRMCWDWIIETAAEVQGRPFVILGDLNTDPSYPKARCGDRIGRLVSLGWQHATPREGVSFWSTSGHARCIDHAFVTSHFTVRGQQFVYEMDGCVFAGRSPGMLSDHAALLLEIARTAAAPAGRTTAASR